MKANRVGPLAAVTTSKPIPVDTYADPTSVGVSVIVSGVLTYSVEYTYDDIFASAYVPASGNWFSVSSIAAQTTSKDAVLSNPATAVRLNITAYTSGTGATFTVIQSGMPGRS